MDTIYPPELARRIGVSLPTVHAILDRRDVPRTGRGVPRAVPPDVAARVTREHASGYTDTEVRVLAALAVSPLGLTSARRVAAAAGVSPTSASAALTRLEGLGLVRRKERRTLRAGRAVTETLIALNLRSSQWPHVESAVRTVVLPERQAKSQSRLPRALWHLFWNTNPATLRLPEDGAYIARRMLNSTSIAAAQWALQHVDSADLLAAVSGRGTDERTRTMVRNWIAGQGDPAPAASRARIGVR